MNYHLCKTLDNFVRACYACFDIWDHEIGCFTYSQGDWGGGKGRAVGLVDEGG